jgi:hypothetical protein
MKIIQGEKYFDSVKLGTPLRKFMMLYVPHKIAS